MSVKERKVKVVKSRSSRLSEDKINVALIVLGFTCIALACMLVFTFFTYSKNNSAAPDEMTKSLSRSLTGKDVNADKDDATNALVAALNAVSQDPSETTADPHTRMSKIEQSDYSVLNKQALDPLIHFSAQFKQDTELQNASYNALLALAYFLRGTDGTVGIVDPMGVANVYVDQETGRAFVPVSIMSPKGNGIFTVEMVYIDGSWKVAPYSLLEQVSFSASHMPDITTGNE